MIEFYPQIKLVHIACVLLSGGLFAARGVFMMSGSAWSNHALLKWTSYVNDSFLLTAGLLLMQITRQYPVTHDWLSVKLSLLVLYIVLGILSLRAGRTRGRRSMYFAAALGTYLFMFSVAHSHDPLGVFRLI